MTEISKTNPFIRRDIERVPAELVAAARRFQASILADVGGRRGTLGGRIQPLAKSMKVAGPAFTVEVRPGDNLMIHAALALAKPGDVIVVDGKGDLSCALTGALMAAHAKAAGIAGFVIDAAVRDTEELVRGDFPGVLRRRKSRMARPRVSPAASTGRCRSRAPRSIPAT